MQESLAKITGNAGIDSGGREILEPLCVFLNLGLALLTITVGRQNTMLQKTVADMEATLEEVSHVLQQLI